MDKGVLFEQTGDGIELLKFKVLYVKDKLSSDDIERICSDLAINGNWEESATLPDFGKN